MEIKDTVNKIHNADCIEFMKQMPENSIGAIVTDSPYGLGFMGAEWDTMDGSQFGIAGQEGENDLKVKKNFKILPRIAEGKALQEFVEQWARECYRVLKPGGYMLSFGGTRTYHRMVCAIEDSGFEIREMLLWLYGSGFPKSLNIAKAIEGKIKIGSSNVKDIKKLDGVTTEINDGFNKAGRIHGYRDKEYTKTKTDVNFTTDEAVQWQGWGTALKPACEPICLARKPLSEDSVAENVLKHGTGGININVSRIGGVDTRQKTDESIDGSELGRFPANVILQCICDELIVNGKPLKSKNPDEVKGGIWKPSEGKPAGPTYEGGIVLHTNPQCPCYMLDVQSGVLTSGYMSPALHQRNETQGEYQSPAGIYGKFNNQYLLETYGDTGGASRFFYQAKAAQNEKWFYCKVCDKSFCSDDKEQHIHADKCKTKSYTKNRRCLKCGKQEVSGSPCQCEEPEWEVIERPVADCQVFHPTQKPEELMMYLIKLITPPTEIVLDPFCGTGTTAVAAEKLGFKWITIDKDPIYCKIAQARLDKYNEQGRLF